MFIQEAFADEDVITVSETEAAPPTAPESSAFSTISSVIPMLLIFVVFYFFLIRPQEKRRREKETLIKGIKKGDEVITTGGILGVVSRINDKDDTVDLQIAENTNIVILRGAISDLTKHEKPKLKEIADKKSKKTKKE